MIQKPFVTGRDWRAEISALIDPNKPVRVYRNLTRGCLSIKQGVVRCHTDYVFLTDVSFPVNTRIRDRVRATQIKEVHAYIMGRLSDPRLVDKIPTIGNVTYNPYTHDNFMLKGQDIYGCKFCDVCVDSDGVGIIAW
jgi:hypothetical protein